MSAFPKSEQIKIDLTAVKAICAGGEIDGGEIKPRLAAVPLSAPPPEGVNRIEYCAGPKLYFAYSGQKLYISTNLATYVLSLECDCSYAFSSEGYWDGAKTGMVFVNGRYLRFDGQRLFTDSSDEKLRCGVQHAGRLFAVEEEDGYKLVWSGTESVNDWRFNFDEGGYLKLDTEYGESLDMLEYGEKMLVMREYGITVLSMFGSPENFSVEYTDTKADGIVKNTARTVNGKVVFCTRSGVKIFDGGKISKADFPFADDIKDAVFAMEYAGAYYLCCKSKRLNKNVVLRLDMEKQSAYYIDVAATCLFCSDGLYALGGGTVYRIEEGESFTAYFDGINFGSSSNKTVVKLCADGADVEISNGIHSRFFANVNGSKKLMLRGKKFDIKVTGAKKLKTLCVTAEVSVGI